METYVLLGVTVHGRGDYVTDLPRFAGKDNIVGEKEVVSAGGGNFYVMPLSSVDAIQLARDCADYSENTINEDRLAEVLQHEDSTLLYTEFYL